MAESSRRWQPEGTVACIIGGESHGWQVVVGLGRWNALESRQFPSLAVLLHHGDQSPRHRHGRVAGSQPVPIPVVTRRTREPAGYIVTGVPCDGLVQVRVQRRVWLG